MPGPPNPPGTGLPESQRFLLLGMGVMVLFLIAGTYFIARAVRREMEVSRMQSDFVSAVSHEFRSPLTSIRQLSEILELGRVPSDERRQVYYTTLVRETQRLQRLRQQELVRQRQEEEAHSSAAAVPGRPAVEEAAIFDPYAMLDGPHEAGPDDILE